MNAPWAMLRLRHKIIGKMLSGEIPFAEAMRLQEMESNIELIMAADKHGINLLSAQESGFREPSDRTYCPLTFRLTQAA